MAESIRAWLGSEQIASPAAVGVSNGDFRAATPDGIGDLARLRSLDFARKLRVDDGRVYELLRRNRRTTGIFIHLHGKSCVFDGNLGDGGSRQKLDRCK